MANEHTLRPNKNDKFCKINIHIPTLMASRSYNVMLAVSVQGQFGSGCNFANKNNLKFIIIDPAIAHISRPLNKCQYNIIMAATLYIYMYYYI